MKQLYEKAVKLSETQTESAFSYLGLSRDSLVYNRGLKNYMAVANRNKIFPSYATLAAMAAISLGWKP